jgi:hypothetical protein
LFGFCNERGSFLFRHAGDIGDEGSHPHIMLKYIPVDIQEPPVECIPEITPRTVWVIAHLQHVPGTGYVGFGTHQPAIGKLTHPIDIGDHDPVICINKEFREPVIDPVRMEFGKEHDVAQHHETFNMVAVGIFENPAYRCINGSMPVEAVQKQGGTG